MVSYQYRGFSLAEVLLSIGTLVLVILTVLALTIALNRGSRKSSDVSAAQYVADQVFNLVVETAQRDNGSLHKNFWDPDNVTLSGSVKSNSSEFFYKLDAATVKDTGGQVLHNPATSSLANNRLKFVQIEVHWWSPSSTTTRSGYGKLTTVSTRLVREKPPN